MALPDYEVLGHTADVRLRARGETMERLFVNAARGMFHILAGDVKVRPIQRQAVEVDAPDREALLVAWLNELLFYSAAKRVVFGEFEIGELSDQKIRATACGEPIDELAAPLETELKAATYHGLSVIETPAGWVAEVLFDA